MAYDLEELLGLGQSSSQQNQINPTPALNQPQGYPSQPQNYQNAFRPTPLANPPGAVPIPQSQILTGAHFQTIPTPAIQTINSNTMTAPANYKPKSGPKAQKKLKFEGELDSNPPLLKDFTSLEALSGYKPVPFFSAPTTKPEAQPSPNPPNLFNLKYIQNRIQRHVISVKLKAAQPILYEYLVHALTGHMYQILSEMGEVVDARKSDHPNEKVITLEHVDQAKSPFLGPAVVEKYLVKDQLF